MKYAALATCLAACGFSGSPGAPSSDADPGVDTVSNDAKPDGSPAVDSDGDSLADSIDNCPTVPNLEQRDFDNDLRGDLCDPCPHLANQDDDPDADEIGNGCDPRPTIPDQRLVWTSFHDATTVANWAFTPGWVWSNGKLVNTNTAIDYGTATLPLGTDRPGLYVATKYSLDAHGIRGGTVDATGAGVASANTTGQYNACIVLKNATDKFLVAGSDWPGPSGNTFSTAITDFDGMVDGGAIVELVHDATTANNKCAATQPGADAAEIAGQRSPSTDGVLFLYTQRAAASYEYVFVVAIGS